MIRLMTRLLVLVPSIRKKMYASAALKAVETLFMGIPYGILLLTLHDLLKGSLTMGRVGLYTMGMAASFAAQGLFCWLFTRIAYPAGTELCEAIRIKVGSHLRTLPMRYFSRKSAGDTTALVSDDLVLLTLLPRMAFPQFISALVLPLVLSPFLFSVDWRLALASLAPVPLALPMLKKCQKELSKGMRKRSASLVAISSAVIEYVQGMEVVKGFRQTGERFRSFAAVLKRFKRDNLALVFNSLPFMLGFQALLDMGFIILMVMGAYLFLGGQADLFAYLTFLVLGLRMYEPIKALGTVFEITQSAEVTVERIEALLRESPLPEGTASAPEGAADITFKDVSFSYGDKPVLKNVSFTIPAHSVTAFVGPSGSGKTTILRLIARLWDADSGEVLFGSTPVRQLTTDALFSKISMVFQDTYLFKGTILENIAFGSTDATPDDIRKAAEAARCHDFITALPAGYDTPVGEGGATLSGGEKQRISIARAILKDAPVILLDEATASIDPDNESQIQNAVNALVRTKTVVLVAHRLATVTSADQIVVMDGQGGIEATGRHEDLLERSVLYQRLWTSRQQSLSWKVEPLEHFQNEKALMDDNVSAIHANAEYAKYTFAATSGVASQKVI